jgi:hypothetical protein
MCLMRGYHVYRLCFGASHIYIHSPMAGNPKKRKRGKNRAIEVELNSVENPTVTYEHTHYDTPAGRFTKRKEVPYKYVPSASSAPKPSQSNVIMDDELIGTLDTGVDQEPEPSGTMPGKKRNKVSNSIACAAAARIDNR